MAIYTGDGATPAHLLRDHSEIVAEANNAALREALAAMDIDPEPEPEVYP